MISDYVEFVGRKCDVLHLHSLLDVKLSHTLVERVSPVFPLRVCCWTLLFCGGLSVACSCLWYVGNISQQQCALICGKVKENRKRRHKTSCSYMLFYF